MSPSRRIVGGIAALTLCAAIPLGGQQESIQKIAERVNQRFLKAAPEIGETMPNVQIHDADGNRVWLHDLLRGHHTVLVLGCLT